MQGASEDEFQVALIGFGLAGSAFHAPFIADTPGLRLAAIVTRNEARRAQAHSSYPDALLLASADEILSRPRDFDIVVVASPNPTHVRLASQALAADLHVVVDKPFAGTSAEGRDLVSQASDRGLLIVPFHNRRWDGDFLTVRRLADDGALGDIYRFESRFERWKSEPRARWCAPDAAAEHEGIVYDIGPHLVDQAIVLLGPVRCVYAEFDRRHAGIRVEDDAFMSLTHESGARSRLYASIAAALPGPRFLVHGSRSAYVKFGLDPQEERLRAGERPGTPGWGHEPEQDWGVLGLGSDTQRVATAAGDYGRFYEGIVRTLRGGESPPVDARDAVRGLEILEAAFRSSKERQAIELH